MDFYEVEGKAQFARFGIPTEIGTILAESTDISGIQVPCVLKAQVLSGKRGKAGGIKVIRSADELAGAVDALRSLTIGGQKVENILVAPFLNIAREHYLGITLDALGRQLILLYSPYGGMDIEQLASEAPEKLIKLDVSDGVDRDALTSAAAALGAESTAQQVADIACKLYNMYKELDATTVEINPLAELPDGSLTAADAKLVIDDSALYRQGDYVLIPRRNEYSDVEKEAKDAGVAYVEVDKDGNTGLVVSGAGLGMATLDTVKYYGLKPYNFIDLGSRMNAQCMRIGMRLVLQNPNVNAIIINGFGGMYTTTEMADWILEGLEELGDKKIPVVVKIRGNKQEEGWKVLRDAGIPVVGYGTTDEAVRLLLKELEAVK